MAAAAEPGKISTRNCGFVRILPHYGRFSSNTNVKSIAYFSVKADTPNAVNEVFRRLNIGGVALTQLELVLGKIKADQPDYEERLWAVSEKIAKESGGIEFSSSAVLQILPFAG